MEEFMPKYNESEFSAIEILPDGASKGTEELDIDNNYLTSSNILTSSNYFTEPKEKMIDIKDDIYFLIQEEKLKQKKEFVIQNCPIIRALILTKQNSKELNNENTNNDLLIEMPKEITVEHLNAYYTYVKNVSALLKQNVLTKLKVLLMSIYFHNHKFSNSVINECILQNLSKKNVLEYIKFSIEHLTNKKENYYWNLIINKAKTFLSEDISFFLSNEDNIGFMTNSFIEDVISLYLKNTDKEKIKEHIKSICDFICHLYNYPARDLLVLLEKLYSNKFEKESIDEFLTGSFPTIIELKGSNDFEISIDDQIDIAIQLEFDSNNDKYTISFKDKTTKYFIHSLIYFTDSTPSVNFSQLSYFMINKSEGNDKLYLHLRIDYIFTYLFNFIIDNIKLYIETFIHFSNNDVNKDFIAIVFKGMRQRQVNNSTIINCLMIYFDNMDTECDDINSLLENINFREVKLEFLSEFYLKYNDNETINKQYLNSIVKILKDNHIDKVILHCAKQLKIKERITASKTRKKEKGNFEITNENFEMINDSPPKYKKSSTYVKKKNKSYLLNSNDDNMNNKIKGISFLTTSMNTQMNDFLQFPTRKYHTSSNNLKTSRESNLSKQKYLFKKHFDE